MSTKTVLATIVLAALGFGGALLAFPHMASAWDYGSLPPGCSQAVSIVGSHQVNIWNAGCLALTTRKGNTTQALWVLAHEAAHALGIKPERTADCFASNRAGKLETALGIHDTGQRIKIRKQVLKKWKHC
jgi:hypothetical protein